MADAAIVEIAEYHNDVVSWLKSYFSQLQPAIDDLRDRIAITQILRARLEETDTRSAFFVLAHLEAVFREDYESRCRRKMKDDLSKAFRAVWKVRGARVSLDDDIFEGWTKHSSAPRRLISELRGAFNLRHWVAHGRPRAPRLDSNSKRYDFTFVYSLADDILKSFPFQVD